VTSDFSSSSCALLAIFQLIVCWCAAIQEMFSLSLRKSQHFFAVIHALRLRKQNIPLILLIKNKKNNG